MPMAPSLPDDILYLICQEAAQAREFDTLFNCTLASRGLASAALPHLYREHHVSPVRGDKNESVALAQQELVIQRWSILWRSIVASSLEDTLFPYCRYIRFLDLRDLENLLEEDKFRGKIQTAFFKGGMSRFRMEETLTRKSGNKYKKLNIVAIINSVGDVVTEHTPMLEVISGTVLPDALKRWTPRLPHLKSLELRDGHTLSDDAAQAAIQHDCAEFEALSILAWLQDQEQHRDTKIAAFISGLQTNTLRDLTIISDCGVAAETFLSLAHHRDSLKTLHLSIRDEALPNMGLLASCSNIQDLKLENYDRRTDLKAIQNDVFQEIIQWLRSCKSLRELQLIHFSVGVELATAVLFEDTIRLEKLDVDHYVARDHQTFHHALANQKETLRSLFLSGDGDGMVFDDLEILTSSIAQLTQLRDLELRGVSDFLRDEHIIRMVTPLEYLEDFYISGSAVSDLVLPAVSRLSQLKTVSFNAISSFSIEGLLDFVQNCGPGNRELVFDVAAADPDRRLSPDEQELVKQAFAAQLSGRFEYTLWRDPDVSEFEQSDSD